MIERRGVLFDMDGVLVATEPVKALAHAATVKGFGGKAAPSFYQSVMGQPYETVARAFARAGGVTIDSVSYRRVFRETYRRFLEERLEATPGAVDLLRLLTRKGYLLGMVSSSERWMMDQIFAKTRLDRFFPVSVSADDVKQGKPSPEPHLHALGLLELPPERAIAIEDSEAGIESARNADLRVLALRHQYNSMHDFSRADAVFVSLRQKGRILKVIESLIVGSPTVDPGSEK